MSKLVPRVASVPLELLLGVLAFPVSSNSTVGENVWEAAGRMVAVILLDERVSVAAPVCAKVEQGALDASTVIPVRPAGTDAAPESTHHS